MSDENEELLQLVRQRSSVNRGCLKWYAFTMCMLYLVRWALFIWFNIEKGEFYAFYIYLIEVPRAYIWTVTLLYSI